MDKATILSELKLLEEKLGDSYVGYFETSAKTGDQVNFLFEDLVRAITSRLIPPTEYQNLFGQAETLSNLLFTE